MNNEYSRMRQLLEPLGLSFEEGSVTGAEIYAYSKGAELVKNSFYSAYGFVFYNMAESGDIRRYAEMLSVDTEHFEGEALEKAVKNRFSHRYADYTAEDLREAFNSVGSGDYLIVNNELLFSFVDEEDLAQLGKFIEAFVHFTYPFRYDGEGMTFDEWDAWAKSFAEYDKLNLPFDILDYLSRAE